MKKSVLVCAALVIACLNLVTAAERVPSGLEIGAKVPPFYVKDVTGPAKAGDALCYRCRYGDQPVVAIFAKEMTDEVAALTKEVDKVVAKNRDQKMAGFVVLMSENPEKAASSLIKTADTMKIEQLPLTIFDGSTGPQDYKINKKADITVMMWVEGTVKVSIGFDTNDLTKDAITKVVGETKKILN